MATIRKNFRMNDENKRDIEIMELLDRSRNESELIKNAVYFYKQAIERNVIVEPTLQDEDMWKQVFVSAVPLGFIKEDKERVKEGVKNAIKRCEREVKDYAPPEMTHTSDVTQKSITLDIASVEEVEF